MAGEHRADLIFALPITPQRARLSGDLPGWREGLEARGIEVVDSVGTSEPDLVVADTTHASEAITAGCQAIIEGATRVGRQWARTGHTRRFASVPPTGDPKAIFDLGHRRAAAYGLAHAVTPPERSRRARNRVAAQLARLGALPPVYPIALGVSPFGPQPELVGSLQELGVSGAGWYMLNALGSAVRRNAMFVFDGGVRPAYVVKFSRVPGLEVQFDRDERGLRVAATHPVTARHAPSPLGRFELAGRYAASVETAAPGTTLSSILRRASRTEQRRRAIELGANWIRDVGVATAARGALRGVVDRLVRDVAPRFGAVLDDADIAAAVDAPAVVVHGEVFEEHIVIDDRTITVIDWEHATETGLPLADLLFYATNVLAAVDEPRRERPRTEYMTDLFAGRAPSSPVALRWIADYARALQLPPGAVAPLATLYWLARSDLSRVERERAERETGETVEPSWLEKTAAAWLADHALGTNWTAWMR